MDDLWFYAIGEEMHGPIDVRTLMARMQARDSLDHVRVRRQASERWFWASEIPGLVEPAADPNETRRDASAESWKFSPTRGWFYLALILGLLAFGRKFHVSVGPLFFGCIAYALLRFRHLPASHAVPCASVIGLCLAIAYGWINRWRTVPPTADLFGLVDIVPPLILLAWLLARHSKVALWLLIAFEASSFASAVFFLEAPLKQILVPAAMSAIALAGFVAIALGWTDELQKKPNVTPSIFD